ncbi:hypothetical protein D3C83_272900 [compost metagenome]
MGWEEIQQLKNGKAEVTKATRLAVKMLDYWSHHSSSDLHLRKDLKLPPAEGCQVHP